ncbi:MAG: ChaN family lipoprotein [Terriglobales bacterium]
MATTGILRSRRSAAQLHAIAGVEREIRATDPSAGRKYLRDFHDAYRSYQSVLTSAQVRDAVARAGIVLVGDYHALPNSQRYMASLLRDPELYHRPVVVGVETIFSRDQHILDEWWRREIGEDELRQRIRFDLDWGYDWGPFYEVLSAAREQGFPIYGLDCMPREDMRKIAARDRHAADKIVEISRRHPEALVLALFGESHLAPQHLPALVAKRLVEINSSCTGGSNRKLLTVLQNVDALYWHAAGEASERIEAVSISPDVFCVFNATPLEKYENYRLCLDRWGRDDKSAPDLGPTFYNLIGGLVRFLGINQYSLHNSTQPRLLVDVMPEVYSRGSNALLRRLLSRKGFTSDARTSLLDRVRERGSLYLAPLNTIYVSEFRMTSAAEDATRFLHQACRGLPCLSGTGRGLLNRSLAKRAHHKKQPSVLSLEDAFYLAVFEHALAFFGSRVLHPARPAFHDTDLAEMYDLTREDLEQQTALRFPDAVEALDLLTRLRDFNHRDEGREDGPGSDVEHFGDVDCLSWAVTFTGHKYEYVTEQLGYLAGNDLYDAYVRGRLTPAAVRKLFLAHIDEPGAARGAYFQLITRVR